MKNIHLYLFFIVFTTVSALAQGPNSVRVNLAVTGPYSTNIMDYAPSVNNRLGKMIVTVQNLTRTEQKVYLRGEIRGADADNSDIRIFTDSDYVPATGITLGPLETRQLFSHEIMDLYDPNHLTYVGTSQAEIKRTRHVPEGQYSICVRAFDHTAGRTNVALSPERPTGCFTVFMRSIEPPILIQPVADTEVKAMDIQNVIFSWTIPSGIPQGSTYRLKIVEMFDPKRNPNDAFLSATAPPIFERDLMSPVYVYGPADVPLVKGRRYAWAVTVVDPQGNTSFQNRGRSEVRSFIYGTSPSDELPVAVTPPRSRQAKNQTLPPLSKVKFTPDLEIRNLIRNTFKGKLVWAYRKTEAGVVYDPVSLHRDAITTPSGLLNTPGAATEAFSPMELTASPRAIRNGKVENISASPATAASSVADYYMLGSGNTTIGFINSGIPQLEAITAILSKRAQHQAKINALASDNHYPLTDTKVKLYLKKNKDNSHNKWLINHLNGDNGIPEVLLLGQTSTDQEGNFSLDYNDKVPLGYEVYLSIENPYFEFADYEIPIQNQNGTYDMGEILGLAKTYRLKINVVSPEGTKLDGVSVRLERTKGFYNTPTHRNLHHEVMRDSISGQANEVVAIGKSGAYWPRVFFSNGYTDTYRIIIEGEEIIRTEEKIHNLNIFNTTSHGILYAETDRIPTVTKEITANIPLPVVEGRVLTKQGEIPAGGATVIVRKKGTTISTPSTTSSGMILFLVDLNSRSATTDSLGRFRVENIPAAQEPYEVVVRYKGKETRHAQDLYLSMRGIKEKIDPLFINAELITVTGKVINTEGEPISDATLTWKTGGQPFYSDEEGNFMGSQVEGKHILVSRKPGFKDTEYNVDLKLPPKNAGSSAVTMTSWAAGVSASVKNFSGEGKYNNKSIKPKPTLGKSVIATLGNQVSANLTPAMTSHLNLNYYSVFGDGTGTPVISSDHVIVMSNFYVKVTVKDQASGSPIANAAVKAEGSTESFTTGADGVTVVGNVPGGSAALIVSSPPESFYATLKAELAIDASKDTITVEVNLKAGSQAKGRVMSKGIALAESEVAVEGLEHIRTLSDANGNYVLSGVPEGEYTLMASKEGLLSDKKTQNFTANQAYNVDFSLTDPGFNASSLLGFKLVLHKSQAAPTNPNEFIISGELRDIPDNPVYKIAENQGFRIRFTDKVIVKEGNSIYPKNNELVTDVSEIKLKAFDFLSVTLKSASGIKLKATDGSNRTRGELTGEGFIDLGRTFSSLSGIQLPEAPLKIKSGNSNTIAPINSSGDMTLTSLGIAGNTEGWKLYGITLIPDLAQSVINKEGFNFKGKVKIEGVPLLNNQELNLTGLTITRRGEIKNVGIDLNPAPTLSLVSWKLKLTGVKINQYGLRLAGNMEIPVPSSELAKIAVKELGINNGSLSGGTFVLPAAGIDIFSLVRFKTNPGRDFSFQKISGANHYRFVGAGTINLPKWINQKIDLDNFSIATNGDFSVIAKTDVEVNFANMAQLGVTKFGFDSRTTAITVGGKFRLNIPMFGAGAMGTLHFQKNRAPRMDELGINFNLMSAIALEAQLKFSDDEFRGKGALKLAGISGVGLEFWYQNKNNNKRVGAQFLANMIIPIGPVVKLDKLTGGFDFDFGRSIYKINAGGRITLAADPAGVVALDPLGVGITSTPQGPIFEGWAHVKVMNSWQIGEATMKLDFAKKQFFIDGKFGAGFSLMKGIEVESRSGVHLELYTGVGQNYWFVAGYSKTKIFSIFDTGVTIAAGWNVPKNTHESLSGVPEYVLTNGRLYGGYFGTHSHIKVGPYTLGFKDLAEASILYENYAKCEVFANFKSASFGFEVASGWRASGSVYVWGVGNIASADVGLSGMLKGYYNNSGWGVGGAFSGHARGHIGCDGGCNFITWGGCFNACFVGCRVCPIPCGFKICASASATASYDSNDGLKLNVRLGN